MSRHRVRPSNLGRTALCAAWLGFARFLDVEDVTSPEASEGTRLHALVGDFLEWLLALGVRKVDEFEEIEGLIYEWAKENPVDLEDGDERLIASCLWSIREHLPYIQATEGFVAREWAVEVQIPIPGLEEPGTADLLLSCEREGVRYDVLVDWKFYYKPLNQGFTYAQTAGYWLGLGGEQRTVCIVHLPRLNETYEHIYEPSERENIAANIETIRLRAEDDAWWSRFNPQPAACEHCPCRDECMPSRAVALQKADPRGLVNVARHAEFLEHASVIENQLKASKSIVKGFLLGGGELDEWELEERSGARYCTDATLAYSILSREGLISSDEFVQCSSVSVPKIVSTAGKNAEGKTKKEREALVESILDGVIARKDPTIQLKRKAKG